MKKSFNLVDEPWIPIADAGLVSLKDAFSNKALSKLGGNSVQQPALIKLLQAIALDAWLPANNDEWFKVGIDGLSAKVNAYLDKHHDCFDLYGDKPFLQIPQLASADIKSFGVLSPEKSTGNTTVLTQSQKETPVTDADKALIINTQMAFALAGKKVDNSVVLTPGYRGKFNDKGKPASGKAGSAVGHMGLLHSYILGSSVLESIWLNLFTAENIAAMSMYPTLGVAPWRQMPTGEDDDVARALKESLMGRLIPIGKFCLLADDGVHFSDGIAHASYLEGKADPTVTINFAEKKPKAIWVNPNKRPWRELTSLLQFLEQGKSHGFDTPQLRIGLMRLKETNAVEKFTIWCGGLRVSSNAGEQYASGTDDYLQSQFHFNTEDFDDMYFAYLQHEMAELEKIQKTLWGCVAGYFKELTDINKASSGKAQPMAANQAERASQMFWQLCERQAQNLIDACEPEQDSERQKLHKIFVHYALQSFDRHCPAQGARQLDAWAKCRPNYAKYLKAQ